MMKSYFFGIERPATVVSGSPSEACASACAETFTMLVVALSRRRKKGFTFSRNDAAR
jgi:hypothetical protein